MSRTGLRQNLLGLVDADSDDDLGASFAVAERRPASKKVGVMPPAKKGRPPANKVTKPTKPSRDSTRRSSGRIAATIQMSEDHEALADKPGNPSVVKTTKRGRKPVVRVAEPETEPQKELEGENSALVSPPDSDSNAKSKGTRGRGRTVKSGKAAATSMSEEKFEAHTKADVAQRPTATKRGRRPAASKVAGRVQSPEIPETQQQDLEMVDDDASGVNNGAREVEDTHMEDLSALNVSVDERPRPLPSPAKAARPMSLIDVDDSDSSVRRRLGDLTRKYDALQAQYKRLREVGIHEADRNCDRLKKQGEQRAQSSKDLIASLKEDLSVQRDLAKEGSKLKKQLEAREKALAQKESQIATLEASLADAKKEVKTLSTRLAASRTAEISAAGAKSLMPGSAMKANSTAASRAAANSEAMQLAHTAQMKEDLYGDLTGLIVQGVKRTDKEDVFNCIQTGRNGTLHFKLSIGNDITADNYEDQFTYMPQLDASRDKSLIDILPEYLVEEICFPRPHAAKFYARVMKSVTEKLEEQNCAD